MDRFLRANLTRIGHGHDQGAAEELYRQSGECGIIFRPKLEVLSGPNSNDAIVHLE